MSDIYATRFTPADLKKSVGFYIDLTDGRSFNEVIYPDFPAPVLRNNLDGPELGISRWGMPSPDKAVKHKNDKGITHIRHSNAAHWQEWQTVAHRCLIPAIAFGIQTHKPALLSGNNARWLSLHTTGNLLFFAGIWTEWVGTRDPQEGEKSHSLFAFLTTEASSLRDQDTPVSLPVILTNTDELDVWMTAPWDTAKLLHRPLDEQKLIYL
jgi:putative SOS response-associated peptidase YedK